jgi:predicted TIM-barrel fold metal-dependent hydrolase
VTAVGLVDHHAHAILRERPATLDEFRGLFSESRDPRQFPHVAAQLSYRRGIEELAALLGCEPTEQAVFEETRSEGYVSSLLGATGTEWLLLDDGFPPADAAEPPERMAELADCAVRPVLRLERIAGEGSEGVRAAVASARERGYAALKTIAAYRTGLELEALDPLLLEALEANADDPLPVQVHTGFGDADLLLPAANPALLKPVIERFHETPFVLLHCYPYVREAGWLAHVYANVFFDVSLTIPFVSRPAEALREALELAPASKLLYASDAARSPELYYFAAKRWREALAEVVGEDDARAILRDNALSLYRL